MIPAQAATTAADIAARYGVSIQKLKGESKHWKAQAARDEIAYRLSMEFQLKPAELTQTLNRSPGQIKEFIARQTLILEGFQKMAASQHQAFLNTDEATHIREELERAQAENAELTRKLHWREGRRGDGVKRAKGFTEAETGILRMFVASTQVVHERTQCLYRHVSNIRKKLRAQGLAVEIVTLVGEGYELVAGKEILQRLLVGEGAALPAPVRPAAQLEARAA